MFADYLTLQNAVGVSIIALVGFFVWYFKFNVRETSEARQEVTNFLVAQNEAQKQVIEDNRQTQEAMTNAYNSLCDSSKAQAEAAIKQANEITSFRATLEAIHAEAKNTSDFCKTMAKGSEKNAEASARNAEILAELVSFLKEQK